MPVQSNNGIYAASVPTGQTSATTNTTAITAPSVTWRTTYDLAGHIQQASVQDQPLSWLTNTFSFAPTLLQPTNYDPFGHMTAAILGISSATVPTGAVTISRQYDSRGRILNETDGGAIVVGASDATGTITFSGAEQSTPNYAGASFTFSGTEQTIPNSTYATATLTISGTEQSTTSGGSTIYESGTVVALIFINGSGKGPCTGQSVYGQGSTSTTVAAALASSINSSCASGVSATVNGAVVTVTAKVAGSAGDDALLIEGGYNTNFPSPAFTLTASASTLTNGISDSGEFTVQVSPGGGTSPCTSTVTYGASSTPTTLAAALASSINGSSSCSALVSATSSGPVTSLVAKTTGSSANYSISAALSGYDSASFSSPSFTLTPSGTAMTGGGTLTYDSGLFIVSIGGVSPIQLSYGQNSTPQTLASTVAQLLTCGSSPSAPAGGQVSGTASGATVALASCADAASADLSISAYADGHSPGFAQPSFSVSASGAAMTGGSAGTLTPVTIYSYNINPSGGYAPNGNILQHTDSVMGTWNFTYDTVDRLMTATPGGNAPTQYQNKYGCWSYDSFGNRTLEAFSIVPCSGSNPTPQIGASYNPANNRIQSVWGTTSATYSYDASGNTLYDGVNQYWSDAEGQLCAVQRTVAGPITQYVYDAEGARIAKGTLSSTPSSSTATCAPPQASGATLTSSNGLSLTSRYLVDQGGDQVTELSEGAAETWAHSNIWAGGKLTATYDTKGIHYELTDPLGTKRVQANALGQVDEQCTGLPFGNDLGNPLGANCSAPTNSLATNDDATEHHYTGKERDTESGNDYFEARYYSSSMGRFMSPDWSAQEEPVPYAKLDNPQSLNLYSYTLNNPLILVDTDGHELKVAAELQDTVATMRKESPSFNGELSNYEGPGAPNLTIGFGNTPNDPSGTPSIGNTSSPLIATPDVVRDPTNPDDDGTSYSQPSNPTTTITISNTIKGDADTVNNTVKHEVGHANDARQNTNKFGHDSQRTKETKGKTPHDDRPEEKRANAFKDKVNKEMKQYEKEHKHDKQ